MSPKELKQYFEITWSGEPTERDSIGCDGLYVKDICGIRRSQQGERADSAALIKIFEDVVGTVSIIEKRVLKQRLDSALPCGANNISRDAIALCHQIANWCQPYPGVVKGELLNIVDKARGIAQQHPC